MRDVTEWIEREASWDLANAANGGVATERTETAGPPATAERTGAALVITCPRVDSALFNRVLGVGIGGPVTCLDLARWLEAYRAARITRFFVHLYDDPQPPELPAWLETLGLVRYRRSWDQLARGRDEPLPCVSTSFEIRRASADDAPAVAASFAEGFDLPPEGGRAFAALIERERWHVYVATDQDTVVAAGATYIADGIAYLAGGVTRASHRRRSAQLALLAQRCRAALDLDCRFIVSETGAAAPGDPQHSHHNMQRCGLRVFATRHNYALPSFTWKRA